MPEKTQDGRILGFTESDNISLEAVMAGRLKRAVNSVPGGFSRLRSTTIRWRFLTAPDLPPVDRFSPIFPPPTARFTA
jgi:hypothetical protein